MLVKKCLAIFFSVILLVSCCSVSAHPVSVQAVSKTQKTDSLPDRNKVLSTRFINMLNHNFAYGDAFESCDALVNAATVSLRNLADEDGFIPASAVTDYLQNFYGVSVTDFSEVNIAFEQRPGFVFLIPRGFTQYTHSVLSVVKNEDGTYTVLTDVKTQAHDDVANSMVAETLFVPNPQSDFGFSILYSEFLPDLPAL